MGGYIACDSVPVDRSVHTRLVLALTLLRPLRTKGRGHESEAKNEKFLMAVFHLLLDLLNGDIRLPQFVHFCVACCGGARDCAMKIADAVVIHSTRPWQGVCQAQSNGGYQYSGLFS